MQNCSFKCIFTDGQHQDPTFLLVKSRNRFFLHLHLWGAAAACHICSSLLLAFCKVRLIQSILALLTFSPHFGSNWFWFQLMKTKCAECQSFHYGHNHIHHCHLPVNGWALARAWMGWGKDVGSCQSPFSLSNKKRKEKKHRQKQ